MNENVLICSNCGKPYKAGSKFCPSCGAKTAGKPEASEGQTVVKEIFSNRDQRIKQQQKRVAKSRVAFPAFLLLILLAIAGAAAYYWYDIHASNPEPDWAARETYWINQYKEKFSAPPAGSTVELRMKNGRMVTGELISIEPEKVMILYNGNEIGIAESVVDEKTRYAFFVDSYTRKNARQALLKEHQEWLETVESARNSNPVYSLTAKIKELLGSKDKKHTLPEKTEENSFFRFLEGE